MQKIRSCSTRNRTLKKIISLLLVITIFMTGTGIEEFLKKAEAAGGCVTLYLKDDTAEHWLGNDDAVMELVDNTYGHNHYIMTKVNQTTWSCKVPAQAYNVTFNRLSPDRSTQWNSWSAGGRDGHSTYHATVPEHGYWEGTAVVDNEYFHEGDIIYLDFYSFTDNSGNYLWEQANAVFYINFTSCSKSDNNGQDITISSADSTKFSPILLTNEIETQVYKYIITSEDEGASSLRFFRGSPSTLWNDSVVLNYSDYKAGNNCVKVQGWDNTGYVCPYISRRHTTQIDTISINTTGNLKVNRKVIIDLNITGETEYLDRENTVITIEKSDNNGQAYDSENNDPENETGTEISPKYLFDDTAATWNHRELIFREAGTYKISAVVTDGTDNFEAQATVAISEDRAPVADFYLDESSKTYTRDGKGKAYIRVTDNSVSEAGDTIISREYRLYHDSNNDGIFTPEELTDIKQGNDTNITYELDTVGKYKIVLKVKEYYSDTIETLTDDASYLSGSTENRNDSGYTFEVTNVAPTAQADITKSRTADIIFTVGSAGPETVKDYAQAIEDIKKYFSDRGIEATINTISSSSFRAKDTFAWTEYDHYNYGDYYSPTLEKHITYTDSDIKMTGYNHEGLKDFLYIEDNDSSRKVFEFDLQRDNTNWHSMEGGGFLFNTMVTEEENYIQGYCILVTVFGLRLIQIDRVKLDDFISGIYNQTDHAGRLLETFPLQDLYAEHHLKIIVDKNILTLYDGDLLITDGYVLPDDGLEAYGYGPITSYTYHDCEQQSYFVFKNIVMQTITGESLSDVVNSHKWAPGTNHYVINLSDALIPELSDDNRLADTAAALISNDVTFYGIGNNTTLSRYNALKNVTENKGTNYLLTENADSENTGTDTSEATGGTQDPAAITVKTAVENIAELIMADINSKDYTIGYTIASDEPVQYQIKYSDKEGDRQGESLWTYIYNSSVFKECTQEEQTEETIIRKNPITTFTDTGAYAISLSISDDPTGGNEALADYIRWSDTAGYKKLILSQNRPLAGVSAAYMQSEDDSEKCMVNVTYTASDADHPSDSRKGIRKEEFQYKNINDTQWTEGRFPTEVPMGETYLVKYTATDIEGTESRPAVAAIKTQEAGEYTRPDDTTPPQCSITVSRETIETGEKLYIEATATDNHGIKSMSLKVNGKEIAIIPGRHAYVPYEAGTLEITLTATDICDNGGTASRTVRVVDKSDVTPPTITITSPKNGTVTGNVDIIGSITDDKAFASYRVVQSRVITGEQGEAEEEQTEEEQTGEQEEILLAEGTEEIIDGTIATVETDSLEPGVYKIEITATDKAGLSSSVYMLLTVEKTESGDRIPPTAVISDIALDNENSLIEITGTVSDETELKNYTLKVYKKNSAGSDSEQVLSVTGNQTKSEEILGTVSTQGLASGDYSVILTAEDSAGNQTTAKAGFTYTAGTGGDDISRSTDTEPPVIIAELNAEIKDESLKIHLRGTITDESSLVYTVTLGKKQSDGSISGAFIIAAGEEGMSDAEIASYSLKPYETGDYVLIIEAEDEYGNLRRTGYTITVTPNGTVDEGYSGETGGEDDEPGNGKLNLVLARTAAPVNESVTAYLTYPDTAENVKLVLKNKKTEQESESGIHGRTADITAALYGEYEVILSADINSERQSVSADLWFLDADDDTYPDAEFLTPESESILKTMTDITGTVSDDKELKYYTLEYRQEGTDDYIELSRGTEPVINGKLGTLDTTKLLNGRYVLRLTAVDMAGHRVRTERTVYVECNLKVGNMSIGFTDITSNVAGIPLCLTRNYDSRNKTSGDFGTGWSMGIQSARIIEASDITQGYRMVRKGSLFSTAYYMEETQNHYVTVNYGDGTSDRFVINLLPAAQQLVPIGEVAITFTCVTNPKVKLSLDGDNSALVYGNQLILEDMELLTSRTYILETEGGTKLYMDLERGVDKMEDSNGNYITVSSSGYRRSDGTGITFERDKKGRIIKAIQIADGVLEPINRVEYAYDDNNNLTAVTDIDNRTVSFTYDSNHNMTAIIDPSGTAAARNEYDEDGRLTATVDAQGNRITYTHDIDGCEEIVRDRLGNATVYTYDENGNILKTVDALGNITENTYDENGNLLTKKDALGNISAFEYDSNNNLIESTDALGRITVTEYGTKNEILNITQDNLLSVSMTYDRKGNITSVTDTAGNVTNYTYETDGSLNSISDSIGTIMTLTYDSQGRVAASVDGVGNVVTYTYDIRGNLASTEFTKQTEHGNVTIRNLYFYDASGRLKKTTDSIGGEKTLEYDVNGRILAMTDEKGLRTSYSYDILGNISGINYADGTTESFTYDANGNMISSTDRENLTRTYSYDALGRNTRITLPDGNSIKYEYDAVGNLTGYVSVTGAEITYTYDALGRNTSVTDDDGNSILYTYNTLSELSSVTDIMGRTTLYGYDNAGNITSVTYPDNSVSTRTYDARSRLTGETDQLGNTTIYEYDNADRLTAVTDAAGNRTEYEYDNLGELHKIKDAKGSETIYEYDTLGRRISETDASGHIHTYTYSDTGNLVREILYSGIKKEYDYDECDRLERVRITATEGRGLQNSSSSVTEYTRDVYGRITAIEDENGTIGYTYDGFGRVIRVTDANGLTLCYTYDTYGRKSSVSVISEEIGNNNDSGENQSRTYGTTYYEYDKYQRLTKVRDSYGNQMSYTYNADDTLATEQGSNGVTTGYTYDACGELSQIRTVDTSAGMVADYRYTRDASGEITGIEESTLEPDGTTTGKTTVYTYDSVHRLTAEVISNTEGSITFTYTYDANYNRTTRVISYNGDVNELIDDTGKEETTQGTTVYTYDVCNRLTKETTNCPDNTTKETIYTYDTDGNLLSGISDTEHRIYEYNLRGEMVSAVIEKYGGPEIDEETGAVTRTVERSEETYGYDAEGIRTGKTTSDGRILYGIDRMLPYTQVLVEFHISQSGERIQKVCYHTRGIRLVCREELTENEETEDGSNLNLEPETTIFYLYDGHGNVRALTDDTGAVTDSYSYHAYGGLLTKKGTTENDYLYCGEQRDEVTGLYYLRARYLNPLTGTFTQKDSYEGHLYNPVTQNGYLYTGGNPVIHTDPSGNSFTKEEAITEVAIIGVLTGIITCSYNVARGFVSASYDVAEYLLKSTANAAKFVSAGLKEKITDSWEILTAPDIPKKSIVDGVPSIPVEVGIEIFPRIVTEPWQESFPAYRNESDTGILLGPQATERTFWDNITFIDNGYYKKGLKEIPEDWIEVEDAEELPIKSESFKNFLRKNGKNPKKWRKVVEKWASPDGTIYQRHYWTNGTEYYYHGEGLEEYFPH